MSRLLALLFAILVLVGTTHAIASPSGSISLSPHGPLELSSDGKDYKGSFSIDNVGSSPLTVSRIAVRTDADDPRVPSKVTVTSDKATPLSIAPQEHARVTVTWTPDANRPQKQAFGHIVITSTDEASGEVAMGFVARAPTPLGFITNRPITILVLLPLLIAAAFMIAHASGRAPRSLRPVAIGVAALQTALALWMWSSFDSTLSRVDGNDGLQFIERSLWIRSLSAEWFVGVDGTSLPSIVAVCVIALISAVAVKEPNKNSVAFDGLCLMITASGIGAFVAQDALLWLSFVALTSVSLLAALAQFSESPRSARIAAPVFAIGFASLALAVLLLHADAGKTFLVGGESTHTGWSLPDLARVSFLLKPTHVFGQPLVAAAWSLGFVAAIAFAGAFPLHFWLPRVLADAPAPLGALTIATVSSMGLHTLVRVSMVLPEGARWAATTVLLIGLLGAAYGALAALAERDLARVLGFAMVAQSGLVLVAFGSLTHQGLSGMLVAIGARSAAGALLAFACGALFSRLRTRDVLRVSGLGKDAPLLAGMLVVGALGAMAAPCTCAGWTPIMAAFGSLPRGLGATFGVVLATAILSIAVARALSRLVTGKLSVELSRSALLEPFGGRVPDLEAPAFISLAALALIVIAFGVHPAPLFSTVGSPTQELGAVLNPPGPGEIARR